MIEMEYGSYKKFVSLRSSSLHALVIAFALISSVLFSGNTQATTRSDNNCHCAKPWRTYTRPATQQIKLLFLAAQHADEATFTRLIKGIPDVSEYAVDGSPLLAALLEPANNPGKNLNKQHIRKLHQATLAAKTRMLDLALQHRASATDTSEESTNPPLHLAMLFGTPEMVRLLLKFGADPNQYNADGKTPVEFALDHGRYMSGVDFPELVDAQQRTEMLLDLLAAGAQRPYLRIDEAEPREGEEKLERPAADYVLWGALAELTVGEKIMEAMSKTGTVPAFDYADAALSPLGHAARAGNLGGLKWLKAHAPRTLGPANHDGASGEKIDLWVSAACWALYPRQGKDVARKQIDEVLSELIAPDMQWDQYNDLHDNSENALIHSMVEVKGNTLLNHLVLTGHQDWVRRVVGLGAPVDGVGSGSHHDSTPLSQAVGNDELNLPMIKLLLSLGANPLAGADINEMPLYKAIRLAPNHKDRGQALSTILDKLTPDQKAALGKSTPSPFRDAIPTPYSGVTGDRSIVQMLLNSGISAAGVGGEEIENALGTEPSIVLDLLNHGATIRESESGNNFSSENPHPPLLIVALRWERSSELMARLISAGANPNYRGNTETNAVEWAIWAGNHAALDFLLAHGGRIDTAVQQSHGRNKTSLDLAALSGDPKMVKRISDLWKADLSYVCIPDADLLKKIVLDATDSYWEYLINNGFGKGNTSRDCAKSAAAVRLVKSLFNEPDTFLVGWMGRRVESRLNYFWRTDTGAGKLDPNQVATLWQMARATHREDIANLLKKMGVKDDAPAQGISQASIGEPTSDEAALQRKLAGHYYLKGVREVGSEIILRPDGRFEYMLAYGSDDEFAQGTWAVRNGRLVLRTPTHEDAPRWIPFKLIPAPNSPIDNPKNVSVRVIHKKRAVQEVSVSVIGCDAPEVETGQIGDDGWTGESPGAICQIVLHHQRINAGRGFVYEVPANFRERNFTFEYQPPKEQPGTELNVEMAIGKEDLQWERSGRTLHYVRN